MNAVWNRGDVEAVDRFLADEYTIHSDPGDPWDGATLSRAAFKERLTISRAPFPDLRFDLIDVIADNDRVAISWTMHGTQTGALGPMPATGRRINVQGMTVYYFRDGRITGHRQVVDRVSVAQQLGLSGAGTSTGNGSHESRV
ncbi:MAG: ester cyclase [Gemmatimonadaceae bacterium]|nr:ester cyclase [Gemmatimonadaceae bacterium]